MKKYLPILVALLALACAPQVFADGSQTYSTPGTYTFTVPSYGTLIITVNGGGGATSTEEATVNVVPVFRER